MTTRRKPSWWAAAALVAALGVVVAAQGQPGVTIPKQHLGFNVGDDYHLATYTQLVSYWNKLDAESDRMAVVEIGRTAEDRPMIMAIITSPDNHKKLERYREISRRLALAEGLTDEQARALAAEGRAVVWIDGGLHGTEVTGAQQLLETAYQMTSRTDPETMRILQDVILLLVPVNPDGMELVSGWYMRSSDPTRRTTAALPRLYQKYIGHDNNRDFYVLNQPETQNIGRVMFIDWIPQIMYNHHQTGPVGVMLFAPPFRDPFNYNQDPLVPMGIDLVGAAMHNRFLVEGKPGATMRNGASYSTWFNGGIRTTVGFHNQIGLLTEMKGSPTPMELPLVPERQLASGELPAPIPPQKWHFRQSIEYSISANRAVLDIASRFRENFLFNIYRMGKNSIERGSRDHWTITPNRIGALLASYAKDNPDAPARGSGPRGQGPIPSKYYEVLRDPAFRDPRGYIIPSDQPDFLTATKFVNNLMKAGVTIHRATQAFQVAGKSYPAGSYVVKAAQAFRPHLRDMFEPQNHPQDFPYPGGPPTPPYDVTGYTLAFQMGVQFDRILDGFDGPFEKIPGLLKPAPGAVASAKGAAGFLLDHRANDAFRATNRLLAAKEDVYWLKEPFTAGGKTHPAGTIYIPSSPTVRVSLDKLAAEVGLTFEGTPVPPAGEAYKLRPTRIGVADVYGGSMPAGWVRWLFEQQFECPFEMVYPAALDAGNLSSKFDVLVFADGLIRERDGGGGFEEGAPPADLPAEYRDRVGRITIAKTVPQLRQFVEQGGTILAIGGSTSIAYHLGLPVADALVERFPDGTIKKLTAAKFYIPGSVLRVDVDNTSPLGYGFADATDVLFDESPVFRLRPNAALAGTSGVAWYSGAEPLRSGWAWGQGYLDEGLAVIDATLGKGKVLLFGPEITFRGQPHVTFKFLFNGVYYGTAKPARLGRSPKTTN
ncbi:MAG: peptidase [Acidobacteria bacterium]|nr:peptidase [Acidobacteriota bacterium]